MKNIKYIKSKLTKRSSFDMNEQGNSLTLTIDLNNENDVEEIEELLKKYGGDDLNALWELIENNRYVGNGWDVISASEVGALSEAPCIVYGLDINDAGIKIETDDTKIWYYNDYMITNPIEVLLENGSVKFTKL
jgi:hypothetical protein